MDLVRQARKASSAMQDPEPVRGLMVAGFLVLVGLVSYFSTDTEQASKKVHGKTEVVSQTITHPATGHPSGGDRSRVPRRRFIGASGT